MCSWHAPSPWVSLHMPASAQVGGDMLNRISGGGSYIAVCVVRSFKGCDDSGCEAHGMLANSRWRGKGGNPLPECRSGADLLDPAR